MNQYLSIEQVAARFGVCRKTIDNWIKRGTFPAASHRCGCKVLWLSETIDEIAARGISSRVVPIGGEAR